VYILWSTFDIVDTLVALSILMARIQRKKPCKRTLIEQIRRRLNSWSERACKETSCICSLLTAAGESDSWSRYLVTWHCSFPAKQKKAPTSSTISTAREAALASTQLPRHFTGPTRICAPPHQEHVLDLLPGLLHHVHYLRPSRVSHYLYRGSKHSLLVSLLAQHPHPTFVLSP
jgi:hypothetical protein